MDTEEKYKNKVFPLFTNKTDITIKEKEKIIERLSSKLADKFKEYQTKQNGVIYPKENTSTEISTATHFIQDFLLDNNFNLIGGDPKLGKSRMIYQKVGKHLKAKEQKGLIYSTENERKIFFNPLLKVLNLKDQFIIYDTPINFVDLKKTQNEKIKLFLEWFKDIVEENKKECSFFCLDPLPKFVDWNNENQVSYFFENGLMKIARENQVCILGFRNAGKEEIEKEGYHTKGSSTIQDTVRQILTAQKIHKKSAIGKAIKTTGEGTLFYTSLSSYFKKIALVYTLEVETLIEGIEKIPVAVPFDLTEQVKDLITETIKPKGEKPIERQRSIEEIKFLCSKKSGGTATAQIIHYLQENKVSSFIFKEIQEALPHLKSNTIRKALERNFDSYKQGTETLYILKSRKANQPEEQPASEEQPTSEEQPASEEQPTSEEQPAP